MSTPFSIIPWDTDFFTTLRDLIVEHTHGHPERALVVFPHDRPRRYLYETFAAGGEACFVPRVFAVRELFAALRPVSRPVREAGMLDRVALVHTCCRDVAEQDDALGRRLVQGGEAAFFPWGERLAVLLEECLTQNITPVDLQHAETEVAPFGADLLAALGRIFSRYSVLLPERGRTTPGLDAFLAVHALGRSGELPAMMRRHTVFLAGFHLLTGTEEALFKRLWQNGAHCVLHSAPALGLGETPHWSCRAHARWLEKWRAEPRLACAPSGRVPKLHFFSGHDLHSQLQQLAEDLHGGDPDAVPAPLQASPPALGGQAVALTHPELLLPVLHHLPDKECNISLGYPLERTGLHRLIECVLHLAEARTDDGLAPWRPFSELVCHPWLRLLDPAAPEEHADGADGVSPERSRPRQHRFAELMHRLDARIRQASRFQDPDRAGMEALADLAARDGAEGDVVLSGLESTPEGLLLAEVLERTIHAWGRAETLADMADCLAGLAEMLATRAPEVWRRFPLDAECLVRVAQRVIPPLRDNDMAYAPLPAALRHDMLRSLLRAERVPFEADPLTGLQVLGMLETRLLRFSRVFVVDATDSALPGSPAQDPLLPDSLRGLLGLPDGHHREQLAAHTFHRLLAGADEAYLYWQEGSQASGLLDSISQRSRLVEELVWQEERNARTLLKPGDPPLRTAVPRLRPPRQVREALRRTPAMDARMRSMLAAPVSPARLDAWLTCPLAFYYTHVAAIRARDAVPEGDEPAAVGDLLHSVLHEAYAPWEGKTIPPGALTAASLGTIFARHLAASALPQSLPPESAAMLGLAGPERLRRYLAAQPETTAIVSLEREVLAPLRHGDVSATLRGRLDRVDRRPEGLVVLDYKTGSVRKPARGFWEESPFWESLRDWLETPETAEYFTERGDALLQELGSLCPSLQLACYLHLCGVSCPGEDIFDAAWVELRDNGAEVPIFDPGMDRQARQEALTGQIPALLSFVIRHMLSARSFNPLEGAHCGWCSHKNLCIVMG